MSRSKTVPYQDICDAVFKKDMLPAVYRWMSGLSPEQLARFNNVFPCLAKDGVAQTTTTTVKSTNRLQSSRYTMPEWQTFTGERPVVKDEKSVESMLARATSSHLTYGAFDDEQMRAARATPTRTRDNDRSQINSTERNPEYMERWADKMMNTSYRADICHSGYNRTIKNQTADQTVIVYSRGTLNEAASERAKNFVDKDPIWTRAFRELCRSLTESLDATCYRNDYTTIKRATGERFVHPKWSDPIPKTTGMTKAAETYWMSANTSAYAPPKKSDETFKAADQHRACYSRPFDLYPMTDKTTSSFRDDFVDHVKNKDDQPLYWSDMRVKMPEGSGVVGNIVGCERP